MTTYSIIRYSANGTPITVRTGCTLAEVQAHCQDRATSGYGWFDAYDEDEDERLFIVVAAAAFTPPSRPRCAIRTPAKRSRGGRGTLRIGGRKVSKR